jgi:four helix bundle protein
MKHQALTSGGKPFDLHERLLLFACDVVRAVEFLHKRGHVGRAVSYQILSAGTSVGSNYEESDGASSHADFIAKTRIALKEAKEVRFRLRVCRLTGLLDQKFDPLLQESDEIVRILGKIVHNAARRRAAEAVASRGVQAVP